MKKFILTLPLFFFSLITMSQNEQPPKWSISVGAGAVFPVGNFARVNPESTILRDNSGIYFNGLKRDGNSAAKTGYGLNVNLSYVLLKHLEASANFGISQNAVNEQPITNYLNAVLPRASQDLPFKTTYDYFLLADTYTVYETSFSIKYRYVLNRWSFGLGPTIGQAWLSFPDYSINIILSSTTGTSINTRKDNGTKPYSGSVLTGIVANVRYYMGKKFLLSANVDYKGTDFDYTIVLESP